MSFFNSTPVLHHSVPLMAAYFLDYLVLTGFGCFILLKFCCIQIIFQFCFTTDGDDVNALTEILQGLDDIRKYFSAGYLFVRGLGQFLDYPLRHQPGFQMPVEKETPPDGLLINLKGMNHA